MINFKKLQERIEGKVKKNMFVSGQCWEWTGAKRHPKVSKCSCTKDSIFNVSRHAIFGR